MNNFFKTHLFVWLFGIVCLYAGACGKMAGLSHTVFERDVKTQLTYGESLYAKGEYDQAGDVFKKILKQYPDNVDAHYRLGVIYWQQGDMEKSAEEFETVVSIDNTYHKAFYNLGAIFASQGPLYSVQQAADNFKRYLALDPYCANRKQIIDWLKSHGYAFDNIEPRIEINRNKRAIKEENDIISQADMYIKQHEFNKAEELYKSVLARNPSHAVALYKLGVLYMKQRAFVNGRTELLKAISIDPSFSKAYFNLGVLYSTKGETYDVEKAQFFFRKYLELEPDSPQKGKIKSWLRTHEDIDGGRIFRKDLQAPGTALSDDDPSANFKSWLEHQAGKISKNIEE